MSEYDKKVKELADLVDWFDAHPEKGREGGILIGLADKNTDKYMVLSQGIRWIIVELLKSLAEPNQDLLEAMVYLEAHADDGGISESLS